MSENLKELKNSYPDFNFANLAKIANVEVKLTAQLGKAKVPLKDILRYDSGTIVLLDNKENEPVDIFVDNVRGARGTIVAVDNCYGVKVTEILEQQK